MAIITKLDAGKRNLAAAIRLFFEHGDAIAVHTLGAAAQGVIRDVARARKLEHTSILHDNPDIPTHAKKEWLKALNAPRNFFKHADSDPDGSLEFDERANVLLLLDAVVVLLELSEEPHSEANVFIGWFTTDNPELRPAMANNVIGDYCVRNGVSPSDFQRFRDLCDEKILIEPLRPSPQSSSP